MRCSSLVTGRPPPSHGRGKSSLVVALAAGQFPETAPPRVVPPARLPDDLFPKRVPVTVVDTSTSAGHAVVLTYGCDRPEKLERLSSYWLSKLRRKLNLKDEQHGDLAQEMEPIMQGFREVETYIECSALRQIQMLCYVLGGGGHYAQKVVLYPTTPLFDQEAESLKPHCIRALKRIFILSDHDGDGALSDVELNEFQIRCFDTPLQPAEIACFKLAVQEKIPEGVNVNGLTLAGFL